MSEAFKTAAAIILSLGGGGAIVLGLSAWLGKVWANRLMAADSSKYERELALLKSDLLTRHATQLALLKSDLLTRHATQLEQLKTELELAKDKLLAAHYDKVALYRGAVDIIAPMVAKIDLLVQAKKNLPVEFAKHALEFETERLRAYGYLAMFAPQSVEPGLGLFDGRDMYLALGGDLSLVLFQRLFPGRCFTQQLKGARNSVNYHFSVLPFFRLRVAGS